VLSQAPWRLAVAVVALALCACSAGGAALGGNPPGPPTGAGDAQASATPTATSVAAGDRQWAAQALQVLDTVDAGVTDYHAATQFPYGSAQRQQLSAKAYSEFQQAVSAHQALLPQTEQVKDAKDRDAFVYVLGNIGGFLTPTPDLPADPPSLGDRIARSLDNAILVSSALRPKLDKLAKASG
jgi:hypothetical protein